MKNVLLLILVLVTTGCASLSHFPTFEQTFSQIGIVRWNNPKNVMAGQIIIAKDSKGTAMLRFSKDAPTPLLELQLHSTMRGFAKGPLSRSGWSGTLNNVPKYLELWFSFCRAWQAAIAQPDGKNEIHTPAYRAAYNKSGGIVRFLNVQNSEGTESLMVQFQE